MNFKALLISFFCVVTASAVTAQNVIANQYSIGSTGNNDVWNTVFDVNGNYYQLITVSFNNQNQTMGNIEATPHGSDFFVITKRSNNHDLIWTKSYGGDSSDIITSMVKVHDGLILCGSSNSPISGTKTIEGNNKFHIWIQKISFDGVVQL